MSPAGVDTATWQRALVVFSGATDLGWLRLLRPGFRHCFVALGGDGGWICVNPMAHRTEVSVLPITAEFDLAGWYHSQGLITVATKPVEPPRRPLGWRPYTCVEEVKRLLGITARTILTPWQLYRFLRQCRK
ncbi:hypothetical protein CU669_01655 [Paramagnetospirillum kuznetsovii]|uniref:Uncharacterized protein n=1 Tax=Paramagnetospirillum kuznetsovii TaxID=2053833 RepID=A0A364P3E5_9PROT|nr:hypothetical protein [Paramagnetospirillum kuznetsovii]RAU23821.1 hypothetical protein CU669_01655 [Paramagnetospirillum kuznetsovii]